MDNIISHTQSIKYELTSGFNMLKSSLIDIRDYISGNIHGITKLLGGKNKGIIDFILNEISELISSNAL